MAYYDEEGEEDDDDDDEEEEPEVDGRLAISCRARWLKGRRRLQERGSPDWDGGIRDDEVPCLP